MSLMVWGSGATMKQFMVESSVNNKSDGFDYEAFVNSLKSHYWRSRSEKPWD